MRYEDFDLADGEYPLSDGERMPDGVLHVWTQGTDQWACRAYDHGPFCRRCTRLDPVAAACISMVVEGTMEVFDDPDKGLMFLVSPAGRARVETAIRRGGFDRGLDA
jgi:hypothetical protein